MDPSKRRLALLSFPLIAMVSGCAAGPGDIATESGPYGSDSTCRAFSSSDVGESCTALEVIGIYQARTDHSSGYHPRGIARVTVKRPGRLALHLSSYEPVDWVVTSLPGVVLEGIVATGYHLQRVTAPPGVPVRTFSSEEGSSLDGALAYSWSQAGAPGGHRRAALRASAHRLPRMLRHGPGHPSPEFQRVDHL